MPPCTRRSVLTGAAALAIFPVTARGAPAFSSRRITVTTRGPARGRDVVLIPGLASDPGIWRGLTERISDVRWHMVHVRGFAGLAAQDNARGPVLDPVARAIEGYILALSSPRPVVIGHSMGGTLALQLALAQPLASVMVVDMLPDGAAMLGGTSAGMGYLAGQLNGYFTGTKAGRQLLADMVRQTPGGRTSDPHVIAQALSELAQRDLGPHLSRLRAPLDVVYALANDRRMRAAQSDRFARAYATVPGARVDGIGPSGHNVMIDQPDQFAARVKKMLDRIK